jgi:hypothetical protein
MAPSTWFVFERFERRVARGDGEVLCLYKAIRGKSGAAGFAAQRAMAMNNVFYSTRDLHPDSAA